MEKNKFLAFALMFCYFMQALQWVGIIILTAYLVHWHLEPEAYGHVQYTGPLSLHLSLNDTFLANSKFTDPLRTVFLNDIRLLSLYSIYLQTVATLLLIFFILKDFVRIIRSVKQFNTFRLENISTFRRIGRLFVVLHVLTSIKFVVVQDKALSEIDFSFTPLVLAMAAFMLAEVFREGNRLYEEEQLTV